MADYGTALERLGSSIEGFGQSFMDRDNQKKNRVLNKIKGHIDTKIAGISSMSTPDEYDARLKEILDSLDDATVANITGEKMSLVHVYNNSRDKQDLIDSYNALGASYRAKYDDRIHQQKLSSIGTAVMSALQSRENSALSLATGEEDYAKKLDTLKSEFSLEYLKEALPYEDKYIEEWYELYGESMFSDYEFKKNNYSSDQPARNQKSKFDADGATAITIVTNDINSKLKIALETNGGADDYKRLAKEAIEIPDAESFAEENNLSVDAVKRAFSTVLPGKIKEFEGVINNTYNAINVNYAISTQASKFGAEVRDLSLPFEETISKMMSDNSSNPLLSDPVYMISAIGSDGQDAFDARVEQEAKGFFESNLDCSFDDFEKKFLEFYDANLAILERQFQNNKKAEIFINNKKGARDTSATDSARELFSTLKSVEKQRNEDIRRSVEDAFKDPSYIPTREELDSMIQPEQDSQREDLYVSALITAGKRAIKLDMEELSTIDLGKELSELLRDESIEDVTGVFISDESDAEREAREMGETGHVSEGGKFEKATKQAVNFASNMTNADSKSVNTVEGATIMTRYTGEVQRFFENHPEIEPTYYNVGYVAELCNTMMAVDGVMAIEDATDILYSSARVKEKTDALYSMASHLSTEKYNDFKGKIERYEGQSETWKTLNTSFNNLYKAELNSYGITGGPQGSPLYSKMYTSQTISMFEDFATAVENMPENMRSAEEEKMKERISDYVSSLFVKNMQDDVVSKSAWTGLTGNYQTNLVFSNDITSAEGKNPWASYVAGGIPFLSDNPSILADATTWLSVNPNKKKGDFENAMYHKLNPSAPEDENFSDLDKKADKPNPYIGLVNTACTTATQMMNYAQDVKELFFEDAIGMTSDEYGLVFYSPSKNIVVAQNPNNNGSSSFDFYAPKEGFGNELKSKLNVEKRDEDGNEIPISQIPFDRDSFECLSVDSYDNPKSVDVSTYYLPKWVGEQVAYYKYAGSPSENNSVYKPTSAYPQRDTTKHNKYDDLNSILWNNNAFKALVRAD